MCSPNRCHPNRQGSSKYISCRVPMGCMVFLFNSIPYIGYLLLLPLYMYKRPSSSVKKEGSHPPISKESTNGFHTLFFGSVLIQMENFEVYVEPKTIMVSPMIPTPGAHNSS